MRPSGRPSRRRASRYRTVWGPSLPGIPGGPTPTLPGPSLTLTLLVLFGFLLAGSAGALAFFVPALAQTLQQTGQSQALGTQTGSGAPAAPPSGVPFTVLLLGSDDDAKFDQGHLLTQSMILVRVDPSNHRATLLSIPRDLWVPVSSEHGRSDKIMHAYEFGGARSAITTVQRNFHVHIDDYAWIGLRGLVKLIDKVGGVDVITSNPVLDDYYPADLDSSNPYAYTRVAVLPGAQHLSGSQALKYVRSRHGDLRGDLGRSQRQQQVLLALRQKGKGFDVADLPDIASTFKGEFGTSIGADRFRSLLGLASVFEGGHVRQVVLLPPYTNNGVIGGQEVLLPNWNLILPVVHQDFP